MPVVSRCGVDRRVDGVQVVGVDVGQIGYGVTVAPPRRLPGERPDLWVVENLHNLFGGAAQARSLRAHHDVAG